MAQNKRNTFEDILTEGLKRPAEKIRGTQEVQEVQEVGTYHVSTVSTAVAEDTVASYHEEMPSTQGRKGAKAKRINLAFTDANHAWLTHEARRRGISITQLVNDIIGSYRR